MKDNKKIDCVQFTEWCVSNFTFGCIGDDYKVGWTSTILQSYYNEPGVKTHFTTDEMYDMFKKGLEPLSEKPRKIRYSLV